MVDDVGHDAFARVVQTVHHVQRHAFGRVVVVAVVDAPGGFEFEIDAGLRALRLPFVIVPDLPVAAAVLPAVGTARQGRQQYYYTAKTCRRANGCHNIRIARIGSGPTRFSRSNRFTVFRVPFPANLRCPSPRHNGRTAGRVFVVVRVHNLLTQAQTQL